MMEEEMNASDHKILAEEEKRYNILWAKLQAEIDKQSPRYEYLLHTWGGFYNNRYQEKHKEKSGYHYFDTGEERQIYLDKLEKISKDLDAKVLMSDLSEGYNTRTGEGFDYKKVN